MAERLHRSPRLRHARGRDPSIHRPLQAGSRQRGRAAHAPARAPGACHHSDRRAHPMPVFDQLQGRGIRRTSLPRARTTGEAHPAPAAVSSPGEVRPIRSGREDGTPACHAETRASLPGIGDVLSYVAHGSAICRFFLPVKCRLGSAVVRRSADSVAPALSGTDGPLELTMCRRRRSIGPLVGEGACFVVGLSAGRLSPFCNRL